MSPYVQRGSVVVGSLAGCFDVVRARVVSFCDSALLLVQGPVCILTVFSCDRLLEHHRVLIQCIGQELVLQFVEASLSIQNTLFEGLFRFHVISSFR
ncbi:hypothetical protein D3C76_226980 [compost metagenome]